MELAEYEDRFTCILKNAGAYEFTMERASDGTLKVTIQSLCKEIGALTAYVGVESVMLSCDVTHTHITQKDFQETVDVMAISANEVIDFLSDKIAVSKEFSPAGEMISSGWCRADAVGVVASEYIELMKNLFGGPCRTVYWFWSGKSVAL